MICSFCEKEFPISIKIDGKRRNLCSRKYCLECSPFGFHNTTKLYKDYDSNRNGRKCIRCDIVLNDENTYKKKKYLQSFCKNCFNRHTTQRYIERKLTAIKLLGNKCCDCNGIFEYPVYDFHHLNPQEKDFNWDEVRRLKWETVLTELKKCVLLCSNCHRLRHHNARVV